MLLTEANSEQHKAQAISKISRKFLKGFKQQPRQVAGFFVRGVRGKFLNE